MQRQGSVLLVKRAVRPGDPWSSDWAFPGGFGDHGDVDPTTTARRETAEELGLAIEAVTGILRARWIIDPWRRRFVRLVPVCFALHEDQPLSPDPNEVAQARWFPLARLLAPSLPRRELLWIRGRVPWVARVRRIDGERIWGLTGGMVDEMAHKARNKQ